MPPYNFSLKKNECLICVIISVQTRRFMHRDNNTGNGFRIVLGWHTDRVCCFVGHIDFCAKTMQISTGLVQNRFLYYPILFLFPQSEYRILFLFPRNEYWILFFFPTKRYPIFIPFFGKSISDFIPF